MAGAVSGNARLSEFTYNKRKWLVAQWHKDAMDAVGAMALRKAKSVCDTPQEAAEISRLFGLGYFSFQSISAGGGLETPDLFAEFLFYLLKPEHPDITRELAREMTEEDLDGKVYKAVITANPHYERARKMLREKMQQQQEGSSAQESTDTSKVRNSGKSARRRSD